MQQYKRILLKISGESLMGGSTNAHNYEVINQICEDIKDIHNQGIEVCVVVGGGNIFRGALAAEQGLERASADYMGMLATVINAICLQHGLEKIDIATRVLSAIPMTTICEPYVKRRASRHIEKGRVVIFAAGTGNPFFTTDTAATLRAVEMSCDVILKATKVDGVYDKDPVKHKDAKRYDTLSYNQILADNLDVMDASSVALAKDNNIPIIVFSILQKNALQKVLKGETPHTLIEGK
jgi:uridylate kinase